MFSCFIALDNLMETFRDWVFRRVYNKVMATEIVGKRCHLRKYSYHFLAESKQCFVSHLSPAHFLFCH